MTPIVVFYSSTRIGHTKKFADSLGFECLQIPFLEDGQLHVDRPFVLVTPTYGGGELKGAVPKPVIHFLNDTQNRNNMLGVISTGNRTFGSAFCLAGKVIARKCNTPILMAVEMSGMSHEITEAQFKINELFKTITTENNTECTI